MKSRVLLGALIMVFGLADSVRSETPEKKPSQPTWGHSHLGEAYDSGPRSKPWVMEGIGNSHFPVTSKHPEVQKWFDQGHTLLHSYWAFEAERSFRWCLKLDPECAMAYWGLARCIRGGGDRGEKFLAEAVKRKHKVTARERDYIELWEARAKLRAAREDDDKRKEAAKDFITRFDKLLIDYPNDPEARLLYWLEVPAAIRAGSREGFNPFRSGLEFVLQSVLREDPDHVGALHYRIHNWDATEARFALDSCLRLSQAAPNSGHLQHMPGHILSGVGLWHEAAIAMDAATRVEKDYMHRRMILPEQNWNYRHNLDYLCYIQEQLGMYKAARLGAEQLMRAPGASEGPQSRQLMRLLVKFERWDEILKPTTAVAGGKSRNPFSQFSGSYAKVRALLGVGKVKEAEKAFAAMKSLLDSPPEPPARAKKPPAKKPDAKGTPAKASASDKKKSSEDKSPPPAFFEFLKKRNEYKVLELQGRLAIAQGKRLQGVELLLKAAKMQESAWTDDPPQDPQYLYNAVGDVFLDMGSHQLAVDAYERTLEEVHNDGFALSGLVVAYTKSGDEEKAREAMAALNAVWSGADPNPRLLRARELQPEVPPRKNPLLEERDYAAVLAKLGPSLWRPSKAPALEAVGADGNPVRLSDYRGKNVVLVFYQGGQCLHCMEQMNALNDALSRFKSLNTEVVAVSKDSVETISEYADTLDVTLLSDPQFKNSRLFQSFDDFEEIELHSTFLIDKQGRVHWSKKGGDPFMDIDFLKSEVKRINSWDRPVSLSKR